MKKISILLFCLIGGLHGSAQVFIEMNAQGQDFKGSWTVYGSQNFNKSIPDEKLTGSKFWNEEWQLATLFAADSVLLGRLYVRYNLLNQEIHFKDLEGNEKVAAPDMLRVAVLHPGKDITKITTVFRNDLSDVVINNKPVKCYLEELNRDDYRLMKLHRKELMVMDARFGTEKKYELRDKLDYFIASNNRVVHLKKLSAENVLELLPRSAGLKPVIKEEGLSLKSEKDVVKLLKIYDGHIKKSTAGKAE